MFAFAARTFVHKILLTNMAPSICRVCFAAVIVLVCGGVSSFGLLRLAAIYFVFLYFVFALS